MNEENKSADKAPVNPVVNPADIIGDKSAAAAPPEPPAIRLKPPCAPPQTPPRDSAAGAEERDFKTPDVEDAPQPRMHGNIVGLLLKSPRSAALTIMDSANIAAESAKMLGAAALCYAAFGLATGFFGGWQVALTALWKAPLIALCSLLLSFPSLYVFTAVSGSPMALGRAFAFGSACLAMMGLLLVGLAPVAWLFAASTESLGFVVVMALVFWGVALPFVTRFMQRACEAGLLQRNEGLKVWFVIFLVVTLQMITVMRPILTLPKEGQGIVASGKMFFLRHFSESFDEK